MQPRTEPVEHARAPSPTIEPYTAVEMACWDIVGKICGQPVCTLMGGQVRDRAESIYYLGMDTPPIMHEVAAQAARDGYRTVYFKVGADDPDSDVDRVWAVWDAVSVDNQMDGGLANLKRSAGLCDAAGAGNPLDPADGTLAVPTGPGLGVELDWDRVAKYAEQYETEGASYAFSDVSGPTPLLPKQ